MDTPVHFEIGTNSRGRPPHARRSPLHVFPRSPTKSSGLDRRDSEPDTLEFPTGHPIEEEINQAFDNVAFMLDAVGLDWSNVAHVNSYHVPEPDGTILAANAEMGRQFKLRMPDHKPIWTCLGVAVLGDPKMRVEIRVTAFWD